MIITAPNKIRVANGQFFTLDISEQMPDRGIPVLRSTRNDVLFVRVEKLDTGMRLHLRNVGAALATFDEGAELAELDFAQPLGKKPGPKPKPEAVESPE